jgi:hypothetical protein
MQLPEVLSFSEPTLIIRCDQYHAEFFMADGTLFESLETMTRQKNIYSDNEASNANPGVSSEDGLADLKQFASRIAEGLTVLKRDGGLEHIYLACEPEMSNYILSHLAPEVSAIIKKHLKVNVMKEDPIAMVERFRA